MSRIQLLDNAELPSDVVIWADPEKKDIVRSDHSPAVHPDCTFFQRIIYPTDKYKPEGEYCQNCGMLNFTESQEIQKVGKKKYFHNKIKHKCMEYRKKVFHKHLKPKIFKCQECVK